MSNGDQGQYAGYSADKADLLAQRAAAAGGGDGKGMSGFSKASIGLSIVGAVMQAIGAYYGIKSAQYQAKSQALTLEFEQTMANMNARMAEQDAQATLLSGQYAAGQVGLEYKQAKESTITRQASSGIEVGVGSTAEVGASYDFAKESEINMIGRNTVAKANAYRTQRVGFQHKGRMAGVSAKNIRATAGGLNPWVGAGTSLINSASGVAQNWAGQYKSA